MPWDLFRIILSLKVNLPACKIYHELGTNLNKMWGSFILVPGGDIRYYLAHSLVGCHKMRLSLDLLKELEALGFKSDPC